MEVRLTQYNVAVVGLGKIGLPLAAQFASCGLPVVGCDISPDVGRTVTVGRDFSLAFSPERVYSGRIFRDLKQYPKVVGGVTPDSTEHALAFYGVALGGAPVMAVRDADTAELVKLMETTYRDVNIALANEFARFAAARGLSVDEAIFAANTQPYSHIHRPG